MIHGKIVERVARRFQILDEPCRLRILQALQSNAMSVGQMVETLEGDQPTRSRTIPMAT
jgi:DNA-binding transcriptional ArsR family regulator